MEDGPAHNNTRFSCIYIYSQLQIRTHIYIYIYIYIYRERERERERVSQSLETGVSGSRLMASQSIPFI